MSAAPAQPRSRTYRVLLAKPGLDGHDRGVHVIASALRDAGFEVIYTGLRQTPAAIVQAAVQEDVDAIGLSLLSGSHMTHFRQVLAAMAEQGLDDVLLFGGGIIPEADAEALRKLGVGRLFGPGTPMQDIVDYLNTEIPAKRGDALI
ncbi:MAG: cobalamin B12-binding domain-containing protein [Candidatus Lambdaproteobacteria bacterium]|nr:cobalamin B12-binding domain-containing protein [Candidatus Lambdaproteobacteria bacterium]